MKKSILVGCALFLAVTFAGCTAQPKAKPPEPLPETAVSWQENAVYGIAFLGYESENSAAALAAWADTYLPKTKPDALLHLYMGGDEQYILLPRSTTCKMEIYRLDFNMETGKAQKGEKLACAMGVPVVLQCNISDLYANCIVELTDGETAVSASPALSLKDGRLILSAGGQDLSQYRKK